MLYNCPSYSIVSGPDHNKTSPLYCTTHTPRADCPSLSIPGISRMYIQEVDSHWGKATLQRQDSGRTGLHCIFRIPFFAGFWSYHSATENNLPKITATSLAKAWAMQTTHSCALLGASPAPARSAFENIFIFSLHLPLKCLWSPRLSPQSSHSACYTRQTEPHPCFQLLTDAKPTTFCRTQISSAAYQDRYMGVPWALEITGITLNCLSIPSPSLPFFVNGGIHLPKG